MELVVVFVLGMIVGIVVAPRTQTAPVTETYPGPAKYMFNGVGEKTTETFTIPTKEWKIQFTLTGEPEKEKSLVFGVFVYRERGPPHIASVTFDRFGEDHTIVHDGPGEYYLKVVSSNCDWRITVTAPP